MRLAGLLVVSGIAAFCVSKSDWAGYIGWTLILLGALVFLRAYDRELELTDGPMRPGGYDPDDPIDGEEG